MLLTECFRWERCIRAIVRGLAPGSSILQRLVSSVRVFSNHLPTHPIRTFSTGADVCARQPAFDTFSQPGCFPPGANVCAIPSCAIVCASAVGSAIPRRLTPTMMNAMSWIEGKWNVSKTDWFPGGQSSRRTPNRRPGTFSRWLCDWPNVMLIAYITTCIIYRVR